MYPYYYGGYSDYSGLYTISIILMAACFVFTLWAQASVKGNFSKYSHVMTKRHLTGAQAAEAVLRQNGVSGVRFQAISGSLTDHYDPRTNIIALSEDVYQATSVAAVGVAAHEAGHAVQYARNYAPIRLRAAIIPLSNFGSRASWPLLVLGLALSFAPLVGIGVLLFSLSTLFQLVTLPVELDASHRALAALKEGGLLTEEELPMARKTLWAAAMTYVAALAMSLVQLLRLLAIFLSSSRGNRRG